MLPELLTEGLLQALTAIFGDRIRPDPVTRAMKSALSEAIKRTAQETGSSEAERAAIVELLRRRLRGLDARAAAITPDVEGDVSRTLTAAVTSWVNAGETPPEAPAEAEAMIEALDRNIRVAVAKHGRPGGPLETFHDRLIATGRHREQLAAIDATREDVRDIARRMDEQFQKGWLSGDLFALPASGEVAGRDEDLRALQELVEGHEPTPGRPLVIVIHGMPGVGKTTLATALAWRLSRAQGCDVPFVALHGWEADANGELLPPADPASVLGELLVACGAATDNVVASPAMRANAWRAEVARHGFPVVILDNARDEQQLRELLPSSSGCLVLVTSRDRLSGLRAHEYRLRTLSTEDTRRMLTTARPTAAPDAVNRLAALTAELPLAIDIVLATLRRYEDLPVSDIAAELADVWAVRAAPGSPDADLESPLAPAAKAVWAAFDMSYRRLRDVERRALCLLVRKPGRTATAFALAALLGTTEARARLLLSELAAANLLEFHHGAIWRFHNLIAAYVAERAAADLDEGRWRQAFRRLLTAQAETAAEVAGHLHSSPYALVHPGAADGGPEHPPPTGETVAAARRWLADERENLLASLVTEPADDVARSALVTVALSIGGPLLNLGFTDDAELCHRYVLGTGERLGDARGQAAGLVGLGNVARLRDQYRDSTGYYGRALAIYRDLGDDFGVARGLTGLGHAARLNERYAAAAGHFAEALEIYRSADDAEGEAGCLTGLGEVAMMRGDTEGAAAHYGRALDRYREAGDRRGEGEGLWGFAELARLREDWAEAGRLYQRSHGLYREAGDRLGEADSLRGLGEVARVEGRHAEAAELFELGRALHRRLGDRIGEADALRGLGDVARDAGHHDVARMRWTEAARVYAAIGSSFEAVVAASMSTLGKDPV
ncbi:tetratricopeptide repeat protein [Phytomonospora sp. NPDC050363]|uniref:tetratricopeptide repeat protein n=1 Tax=Phytomonospora sp. NPDC050363 TaxID=3155642 RepID=UPI0033E455FE